MILKLSPDDRRVCEGDTSRGLGVSFSHALDPLVDSGKSVIVLEHHQAVMAHAVVIIGPSAGHDGGRIVFESTPAHPVAAHTTLRGEHRANDVDG